MASNSYTQLAGAGTTVSRNTGGGITPPSQPQLLSVVAIDTTPDASGNPQKKVSFTYQPPSPTGTFDGVDIYLDLPDSAGGLHVADGTIPLDGTTPVVGVFAPKFIGFFPYAANNYHTFFVIPAPTTVQFGRLYITAAGANTKTPPVQAGLVGETPSKQFTVLPPATTVDTGGNVVKNGSFSGVEWAPLVQNFALAAAFPADWTSNPFYQVNASGSQSFYHAETWDWPVNDVNFQALANARLILVDNTSGLQVDLGYVSVNNQGSFVSSKTAVPNGLHRFTVYALSVDVNGNSNSLVPGVTPAVSFTISQTVGPAGVEYAPLVQSDGVNAFVTAVPFTNTADGTQVLQVTGYWLYQAPGTANFDPRFGGVQIVVDKADGHGPIWKIGRGTLAPLQVNIPLPSTVVTYTFYLQSIDASGRTNTIVPGTTPSIAISVGNAGGVLNLSQALPASLGSNLTNSGTSISVLLSGQFSTAPGAVTINAINANIITTGVLKVGNTTGAPTELDVYDHFGSLIGWVGDDTGNSGFVGAWFKQMYVGGSGPSTAPLVANSSGVVTLNGATFTLNSNGTTTVLNNTNVGGTIGVIGVNVKLNGGSTSDVSMAGGGFFIRATDQSTYIVKVTAGGDQGQIQLISNTSTNSLLMATGGAGSPMFKAAQGGNTGAYGYSSILFNNIQVLTTQQTGPGNASGWADATAQTWANSLLNILRTHGLMT